MCMSYLPRVVHETDLKILQKNSNFTSFFFFFGSKKAIVFVSLQSCPTWKGVACPGITPTFLQNL